MNEELINPIIASVITFVFCILAMVLFSLGSELWVQSFVFWGGCFGLVIAWRKEPFPFQSILRRRVTPGLFSRKEDALELKATMIRCKEKEFKKISICILLALLCYILFSQVFIQEPILRKSEPLMGYYIIEIVFVFMFSLLGTVSFCDGWFIILAMRPKKPGMLN